MYMYIRTCHVHVYRPEQKREGWRDKEEEGGKERKKKRESNREKEGGREPGRRE